MKPKKSGKQQKDRKIRYYDRPKPNFVSLAEGESVEGVFLGVSASQYGPTYKFKGPEGERFQLSGNRVQLDQIFADLMADPDGFEDQSIVGHYLIVERIEDQTSKSGREVAQFKLGHLFDECPKKCVPF